MSISGVMMTMTEQEYNAAEGIRRSDLWVMSDSPEKFKWHMDHPADEGEKSPALSFGSACHKMILEPNEWGLEYAAAPNVDRRTKAGKEEWARFCEENEGRTAVSRDDYDTMIGMLESLNRHPLASEMVSGQHEVPFFWTDPETGEKCKCKVDCIRRDDGKYVVVDYKTTGNAQTQRFNTEIFRYGYHVQAAMYTEGVQCALGLEERPGFVFVAQEKTAPFAVNVIEVSEDVMRYGDSVYHELLRKYHECRMMDVWGGYCEDVANEAVLPGWVESDVEEN